jgi:hypothetical protein
MTDDCLESTLLGKRVTMLFSEELEEDVTVHRLYPGGWLYVRYEDEDEPGAGFVNLHHVQRIVFVPHKPPVPEIPESE